MKRLMSLLLSLVLVIAALPGMSVSAAEYPLSIMEPPVSQNVSANSDVAFSVTMLGGVEPYSFQWQSAASSSGPWSNVTTGGSGYTAAVLTLNAVTTAMSGTYYRCVITDSDNPKTTIESLAARLQVTSGTTQTATPTASYNSGTTANSNIIGINAAITLATTVTVANNPKIYFTTGTTPADTPNPTMSSKQFDYTECIQAPSTPGTFCVKAIATSSNAATSNVATFTYTVTNDRERLSDIKSNPDFLAWKANNFAGDVPQVVTDKMNAVINRMTLAERARFTVGDGSSYGTGRLPGTAGHTIAMIDFGIPQTSLSDGPAGLRITTGSTTSTYLRRPTWWPNGSARSATWNKELVYEMGDAWGAECYYFSSEVQLAPGMNIHRSVLNGRNFEYYSEDPLLSGRTAATEVSGFEDNNPVGMMIKHFAVNNQETNRSNKNTQVGTRALREIYLRNFEYAVTESQPWAIMNSYNQINSVSAAQNYGLNTTIARNEWGFKGFLCTDWGNGTGGYGNAGDLNSTYYNAGFTNVPNNSSALTANNSSRLASGNDTLQYAAADNNGITNSVASATHPLTQTRVDEACRLLLTMVVKGPAFNNKPMIFGDTNAEVMNKNRTLGVEIGEEAVILLKNGTVNGKSALPLDPNASGTVLSLGYSASHLIGGGTGSGAVNMASTDSIIQLHTAMRNIVGNAKVIDSSECGFSVTANDYVIPANSPYRDQWAAADLSAVIYTLGRSSGESNDVSATGAPTGTSDNTRRGYLLSAPETNLINYGSELARSKGIPFIVVINHGTWQIFNTWIDKADAVVMGWQMGMAGGTPTARVLFGQVNPSGKTPTSVPFAVTGNASNGARYNPTEGQFGGSGATNPVYYNEGIYIGYRYYDTFNVPVSFPFGYGLSYTKFEYSNATLSKDTFDGVSDKITASVTVKNTGDVAGKEVVQFYIGAPGIQMPKPVKELKGYEKTKLLQPGESQTITAEFDASSLMSYSDGSSAGTTAGQWLVENGHYVIYFASSSQDIRATKSFVVPAGFTAKTVNANAMAPNATNQATLNANEIKPAQIIVTFKPETGASFQKAYSAMGNTYGYLPELPEGYGWFIEGTNTPVFPETTVTNGDKTLVVDICFPSFYAHDSDGSTNYIDLGLEMTDEEIDEKIEALLNTMTETEKFTFLGGNGTGPIANAGYLNGVPRLGVPEIRMHDGPSGVFAAFPTTNTPDEQISAATWNMNLMYDLGKILGSELRAVGAQFMLGTQYDISRTPEFSRVRDQFGADPFLLWNIAAAETKGVQEQGVVAVAKHFAANCVSRQSNLTVSEQAFNELYTPAFEGAVKDGGLLGIMSSYDQVNGTYMSARADIQNGLVRGSWGYKGFFVTDWGGNHEFTLDKGTDIEMASLNYNAQSNAVSRYPDPVERAKVVDNAVSHVLFALGRTGYLYLVQTYEGNDGKLYAKEQAGRTIDRNPNAAPSTGNIKLEYNDIKAVDSLRKENNEIALNIAREGGVLLKNENGALPIKDNETVAMIGMGAKLLHSGHSNERSYGTGFEMVPPYKAMGDIIGAANVKMEADSDVEGYVIPADNLFRPDAAEWTNGVLRTQGLRGTLGGNPPSNSITWAATTADLGAAVKYDNAIEFLPAPESYFGGTAIKSGEAYTWTAFIRADETGQYSLSLQGIGGAMFARIYNTGVSTPDENVGTATTTITSPSFTSSTAPGAQWQNATDALVNQTGMAMGAMVNFNMTAGLYYKVEVTGTCNRPPSNAAYGVYDKDLQLRLCWLAPSQKGANARANAVSLAETQDKAIVFVTKQMSDVANNITMASMSTYLNLSTADEALINQVAAAAHSKGKKVIVVLHNATSVTMQNWIDNVDAVLQMYYPGQKGGVAMAELMTGRVNPSGRLAQTIPMKGNETVLSYSQSAIDDRNATPKRLSEGILTDYRFYDSIGKELGIVPRYAFGYGLSYTTFDYSDIKVTRADDNGELGYDVTFTVKNTGDVKGSEVAQVYIGQVDESLLPEGIQSAPRQLCGFEKLIDMEPGESRTVTIHLNQRAFSYWDSTRSDDDQFTYADGSTGKWTVGEGIRTIYVGKASNDLLLSEDVVIASYTNETDKTVDATMTIAYYDAEGHLIALQPVDVSIDPLESNSVTAKLEPNDVDAATVKIFLWDSDYVPLIKSLVISQR